MSTLKRRAAEDRAKLETEIDEIRETLAAKEERLEAALSQVCGSQTRYSLGFQNLWIVRSVQKFCFPLSACECQSDASVPRFSKANFLS